MTRAAVFETIKTARGGIGYKAAEVALVDELLDKLGIPRPETVTKRQLQDPHTFFVNVRMITGALDQVQIDTINSLLGGAAHWPISWLAYGLATAWHEARFKPIPEWGKGKGKPYAKPGKYKQPQYGRGLVQLTWDYNYEWADKALSDAGVIKKNELLTNFDLALKPIVAAFFLVKGMEQGAFCGDKQGRHSLARHLPTEMATLENFIPARRIINGTDRAADIADLAVRFLRAIALGGWK
jgi:hypothetical protein